MRDCTYRGCHAEGMLPGGLNVTRRAADLNRKLLAGNVYSDYDTWIEAIRKGGNSFKYTLDWVSCFALAVNEEMLPLVVSSPPRPTAQPVSSRRCCSIISPSATGYKEEKILLFIFTASEIGSIFRRVATISAAMGGCQAEIGVSSAMAARGPHRMRRRFATPGHDGRRDRHGTSSRSHLRSHWRPRPDPLHRTQHHGRHKSHHRLPTRAPKHPPTLPRSPSTPVISTMWSTAQDMNSKYKETSDGGLAVQIPLGLSEC